MHAKVGVALRLPSEARDLRSSGTQRKPDLEGKGFVQNDGQSQGQGIIKANEMVPSAIGVKYFLD